MPKSVLSELASAQAIYMNALIQMAKAEALKTSQSIAFDPQGRVLVDVTLNAEQYSEIVNQINAARLLMTVPPNPLAFPLTEGGLTEALGMSPTKTTTVSLDINDDPDLRVEFMLVVDNALETSAKVKDKGDRNNILDALNKSPKGSIIALQQEFQFNLGLATRVYQKILTEKDPSKKYPDADFTAAHQAATKRVESLVMAAYAKALKGAMNKDGVTLDIAKLNKALDKARKAIMPEAHTILMQEIVKHTGAVLTKKDFKQAKKIAEETTATPNDILHTNADSEQSSATLIRGSDATAHHREQGANFAHVQLITHDYRDGQVKENKNPRIQIRTPSLALKEEKELTEDGYIIDVALKLNTIATKYQLEASLDMGIDGKKPKAFVYNLYTALNDTLDELVGKNLQTQSARHILLGAHHYNQEQNKLSSTLTESVDDVAPVFCFVQGLSVNGFGDPLGYGSGNVLREESTLMAEMALLHTLYNGATGQQKENIQQVMALYKDYLTNRDVESYFSQSDLGKAAKGLMSEIKEEWKSTPLLPSPNDDVMVQSAKQGLANLMAHNQHFGHEYAKLFQSLSVFVETASIGGCKSGNERAQSINGRVAVLDAALNSDNPSVDSAIRNSLQQLAEANNAPDVLANAEILKNAVDKAYNNRGLQAAASLVSLRDQGASAKVEAKQGHPLIRSRNEAEEKASVMTNLHQSKAGKMQAHKGLTAQMAGAWEGHPKSWWNRMTSSPLGVLGGILGVIVPIIAVVVYFLGRDDNYIRNKATVTENAQLQASYEHQHNPDHLPIKKVFGSSFAMIHHDLGVTLGFTPENSSESNEAANNVVDNVANNVVDNVAKPLLPASDAHSDEQPDSASSFSPE